MTNVYRRMKRWFAMPRTTEPRKNTEIDERDNVDAAPERPIESEGQDVLERGPFVERLAKALVGTNPLRATGIVMGLTGSWGSGKSSLLNLLCVHIENKYPNAILVRFDPWLISGRNDLIGEFISELLSAVSRKAGKHEKILPLTKTLIEYGSRLSPALEWVPHIGKPLKAGIEAANSALHRKESVTELRKKLLHLLGKFPHPIIVLIDELDRVEDAEIRTVAQLVRSVADFPGISYLLAYDRQRVAEALGQGDEKRGQAYLEKIVQMQIPLPITFAEEMGRLLRAELRRIIEFQLPANFWDIARYQELETLIVQKVLTTMRDVKRLAGTFHAVLGLVYGEADWIDVLGYAALLTKAPGVVARISLDPERVVSNPLSSVEAIRRATRNTPFTDGLLDDIVRNVEDRPDIRALLIRLFPIFSGAQGKSDFADPLCDRRTLLTVLRLGILPGAWTRERVISFFSQSPEEIADALTVLVAADGLGTLVDRLDDIYDQLTGINHTVMWQGIADFLRRTGEHNAATTVQMIWRIDAFANLLIRWSARRPEIRSQAKLIIEALRIRHEISLVSHWLHRHAFVYGLFGREHRGGERWFLTKEDTEQISQEQAVIWRADLLQTRLLDLSWDAFPIFVMNAVGAWDEGCRILLANQLSSGADAIDNLTLMLFGPDYSTDKATVAMIVDLKYYIKSVKARLSQTDANAPDETTRIALRRAIDLLDEDNLVE